MSFTINIYGWIALVVVSLKFNDLTLSYGAEGGIRTRTELLPLDPEPSASASSATSAYSMSALSGLISKPAAGSGFSSWDFSPDFPVSSERVMNGLSPSIRNNVIVSFSSSRFAVPLLMSFSSFAVRHVPCQFRSTITDESFIRTIFGVKVS